VAASILVMTMDNNNTNLEVLLPAYYRMPTMPHDAGHDKNSNPSNDGRTQATSSVL
jgi:hypothetical protein